jgi:hypothetical protein
LDEARTVRQRILTRLQELEPLVEEYNELKQIAGEMGLERRTGEGGGSGGGSAQGRARTSGAGRRRSAAARGKSRPQAGRAAAAERGAASETAAPETGAPGSAERGGAGAASPVAERVLEAVRMEPGKTVGDYAEILGVAATTLYRPVRELTNDGLLVKRARQLFPDESR